MSVIIVPLVPKMQFRESVYVGNENSGQILVTVYRSGDISYKSTVRCYSRQGTAQVMMDFEERPNTDASIITFLPGTHFFVSWFSLLIKIHARILSCLNSFPLSLLFRRDRKALCTDTSWWHRTWRRGRAPSGVGKPQEWISIWSIYWRTEWNTHQDKRWCRQ